jgi:glucokinase
MSLLLAVDIGGTKLAMGVARLESFRASGRLEHIIKEPIPSPGTPEVVIARILEQARELIDAYGEELASIGISIGGPLDHLSGTVINFPHLPGWRDIPLRDILSDALGAPAALDNDANLGALAEHRWGVGKGVQDMVYVTISTGIGGGVIVGGKLLHGVGSGAGEVGHITVQTGGPLCPCGNKGCLEIMASGTSIARRAREVVMRDPHAGERLLALAGGDIDAITAEIVAEGEREGDMIARSVWEGTAEYIAIGLANIIHVLAPEMIVLGGGVAQAGEQLLEPVRSSLRRHVFYVPVDRIAVEAASLGHDSALLGAATLAAEENDEI